MEYLCRKIEDEALTKMDEECFGDDQEQNHVNADRILCDIIEKLGFNRLVEKFDSIGKWYA